MINFTFFIIELRFFNPIQRIHGILLIDMYTHAHTYTSMNTHEYTHNVYFYSKTVTIGWVQFIFKLVLNGIKMLESSLTNF